MAQPTDQSNVNPYTPPETTGALRGFVWSDVHAVQYVLFLQLFFLLASLVVVTSSEEIFIVELWLPQFLFVIRNASIACLAAVGIIVIPIFRWPLLWRFSLFALAGGILVIQLVVIERS